MNEKNDRPNENIFDNSNFVDDAQAEEFFADSRYAVKVDDDTVVVDAVADDIIDESDDADISSEADGIEEASEPETVSKEEYDTVVHRYNRLLADWDNYKKRTAAEVERARANANVNLLEAMMPVFDDFERVIEHARGDEAMAGMADGIEAVHRKMIAALQKEGVVVIEPKAGEAFDMQRHMAVERVADSGFDPDCVVNVYRVGYEMNGIVIRTAMVSVASD